MTKETKLFITNSFDSLVAAIEHFNRPTQQGRIECTLILLDRAFELLLKATLLKYKHKVKEANEDKSYSLERCINVCKDKLSLKLLNDLDIALLRMINKLRNEAQHWYIGVSEQQAYIFSQAGIDLYSRINKKVFNIDLAKKLPVRVLPLTTSIPQSIDALVSNEVEEVRRLLQPGRRHRFEANLKLRAIEIIEECLCNDEFRLSQKPSSNNLIEAIKAGATWKDLFPAIASINLTSNGTGINVSLRITKSEGDPVVIVKEKNDLAVPVAIQKIDKTKFYHMGLKTFAQKLGLNVHKATALVHVLQIKDRPDFYEEIPIGKAVYKHYSDLALAECRKKMSETNLDEATSTYNQFLREKKLLKIGSLKGVTEARKVSGTDPE